jgi:endonuclease YncB( thermonuclease family)
MARQTYVALVAVLLLAAFVTVARTGAHSVPGIPRIVDGDTLVVDDVKIRLEGIDAPETDQICLDEHAAKWTCGIAARNGVVEHVGGRSIDCAPSGPDRYGRTLATCSIGGENLNAWIVRQGWALAFLRYSKSYVADEAAAREAQRGLWSGAFIAPWDWRHHSCEATVYGALAVPITARTQLCAAASAAEAPSPDCVIKGNVSRKGECIYHLPGSHAYSEVKMNRPGKRWFCTEDEAKAAGCRPVRH